MNARQLIETEDPKDFLRQQSAADTEELGIMSPEERKARPRRMDDWDTLFYKYQPIRNRHEDLGLNHAMWDYHGEQLVFVQQQPNNQVFTVVEGDNGQWYAVPGRHFVNIIGYLVVKVPWTKQNRVYRL